MPSPGAIASIDWCICCPASGCWFSAGGGWGSIYTLFYSKRFWSVLGSDLWNDIKKGKYDELLVYKKNIRKELVFYVKSTPPHVKAARKLKSLDSSKIEYIITEDGPEPLGHVKHKIDYKHYIEKQIKPIADSVLIFFNTDFESLIKGSKQTGLGDFWKQKPYKF